MPSRATTPDSLFSASGSEADGGVDEALVASRDTPPIPGLWVFPGLLPPDVATRALSAIAAAHHFVGGARDQVMLFTRARDDGGDDAGSSLPPHLAELEGTLSALLAERVPPETHATAFQQTLARQAILNLYPPGAGISSHVDLVGRYADGIVGASLTGGCVITFSRACGESESASPARYDVYLPPRSVYVLTGAARWDWAHGIAARAEDVVADAEGRVATLPRGLRVSVTLRYLQPGGSLLH